MKHNLEKRLEDLERQQAEPMKFKLLWYDEEQGPHEPGAEIIKLRWFDGGRERVLRAD